MYPMCQVPTTAANGTQKNKRYKMAINGMVIWILEAIESTIYFGDHDVIWTRNLVIWSQKNLLMWIC